MPPIIREIPVAIKAALAKAKEEERAQRFLLLCNVAGLPAPEREAEVLLTRKFRCDFAWRRSLVVLESEGGLFSGGRHGRGAGIREDFERTNELQLAGFMVLRVPSDRLPRESTVDLVRRALATRGVFPFIPQSRP